MGDEGPISVLLPCPFCGGEAVTEYDETKGTWMTQCESCGSGTCSDDSQIATETQWNQRYYFSDTLAIALLKESRECIAACFRTIAASDDKMIMDRLEIGLVVAGVKNSIGVRLQNFIAAFSSRSSKAAEQPKDFKCATFDQSEITPEIRALMNEGRRKAEQSETGVYDASNPAPCVHKVGQTTCGYPESKHIEKLGGDHKYEAPKEADDYDRLSNLPEWEDGLHACLGGMALEANPHKADSEQWRAWNIGWKEAHNELPDEEMEQRARRPEKCPTCGNTQSKVDYHGFGKRCTVCNTIS